MKFYRELGFESLQQNLFLFKIINNQSWGYLFQRGSSLNTRYLARNSENIPQVCTKHGFFRTSFFSLIIQEWKNLDTEIKESKSISIFKRNIFKCTQPKPNNVFYRHDPNEIRHLREHQFKSES